jgi:phospholipid/cholesterol/gamma-HCH transport system substrate-binding protein
MPRLSQLVRIVVTIAIIAVVATIVWRAVRRETIEGSFHVHAMFRDASGLPPGSKVVIAGVPVGEIEALTIEGALARVSMRLRDDVVLWENAYAEKKLSSLLGDNYIEINPGTEVGDSESGPPNRQLKEGERIPHVVEAGGTDAMLRTIDRSIPKIDYWLTTLADLSAEGRERVNGPLVERLDEIDRYLASMELSSALATANEKTAQLDEWTADVSDQTVGRDSPLSQWLARADQRLVTLQQDMVSARGTISGSLGGFREDLQGVDEFVEDANDVLGRADTPPEEQGLLRRLIEDKDLGESLEEASESGKSFFGTLSHIKTYVGLRAEYNMLALQPRFYVTAEIFTRPDKFYLIELEKGALGGIPEVTLSYEPDDARYTRRVIIKEKLRFTLQLGKRVDWLSVRFGIKESTIGAGFDVHAFDRRLKLSVDLFGNSFDDVPRLKLGAALAVFRDVYILAGIDDVLTEGGTLPLVPYPDDPGVPIQFEEVRYGRDYFAGAMLRFEEVDLAALLSIYGAALTGFL